MQLWAAWACRGLFTQAALQWALTPSGWERPWAALSRNWGRHLGPPQCHPAVGWGAAPLPGAGPGVKGNLLPENPAACGRPWVSGPHTGSGLDLTAADATHSPKDSLTDPASLHTALHTQCSLVDNSLTPFYTGKFLFMFQEVVLTLPPSGSLP